MKATEYVIGDLDEGIRLKVEGEGIDVSNGWIGSQQEACELMVAIRRLALLHGWDTSEERLLSVDAC